MLCLDFPHKSFDKYDFDFPDDMKKLINLLEADNIKINCDLKTLEKLWFAFSETWDAHFLGVHNSDENDTYPCFLQWVKNITIDEANHMNYYGDKTSYIYRPWDEEE